MCSNCSFHHGQKTKHNFETFHLKWETALLDIEVVVVVGSRESCPTSGALAVGCYTTRQAVAAEDVAAGCRQHSVAFCPGRSKSVEANRAAQDRENACRGFGSIGLVNSRRRWGVCEVNGGVHYQFVYLGLTNVEIDESKYHEIMLDYKPLLPPDDSAAEVRPPCGVLKELEVSRHCSQDLELASPKEYIWPDDVCPPFEVLQMHSGV